MSLSRMIFQNQICRGLLLQNERNSYKGFIKVRRLKKLQEETKTRTFNNVSSFNRSNTNTVNTRIRDLWKPFGFTVAFSTACFGGAAIWQYENMRSHAVTMLKQRKGYIQKKVNETHHKVGAYRQQFNNWWNKLEAGSKVFIPICFVNVVIFGLWKIPRFQPIALRYFTSHPGNKSVCWPMLLSTFSHYSTLHLCTNMFVLHSFTAGAVNTLGQEQFLGLYLSAGVISSFTSYLYKTLTKQHGSSLGASGAIMAIFAYICSQYPDTKLSLIFLPMWTFPASYAIKAAIAFDTTGLILGWKFLDHAAHLGGAVCGIAWAFWGNKYLWHNREPILQYWHDLRGAIK